MSDIFYRGRVSAFLKDNIADQPGGRITAGQLYEAWAKWCRSKGFGPGTKQALGIELTQRSFAKKRANEGPVYLDIRFKGDEAYEAMRAQHVEDVKELETRTVTYNSLPDEVRIELRRLGFSDACPLMVVPGDQEMGNGS